MGIWDNVKDWFTKYDIEEDKKKYANEIAKLNEALLAKEREAVKKDRKLIKKRWRTVCQNYQK